MIKKFDTDKKFVYAVLVIEFLVIINCLLSFCKPLAQYEYRGTDLIAPKAIFIEQFMGENRGGII